MLSEFCYNNYLIPSSDLSLSISKLNSWILVSFVGKDSKKFLQNIFTCDVYSLDKEHFSFSAQCNAMGKMLSCFYIFYYQNNISLIVRKSVYNDQLKEINKYIKFFRTEVSTVNDSILLGVSGYKSKNFLNKFFNFLPYKKYSLVNYNNATILYFDFPKERFLVITDRVTYKYIQNQMNNKFDSDYQWMSLDIESGYPILDKENIGYFIPQSVNLHLLNGISFKKGCYIGQEVIAKSEYRNINKYRMYHLVSNNIYLPKSGDNIETKIKNSWKRSGRVLAACRMTGNKIWIQSVLNINTDMGSIYINRDTNNILAVF